MKDPACLRADAPGVRTKKHPIKWTTFENQFTRKKNRFFDELPPGVASREDVIPLFSSFNPGNVFKDPRGDYYNQSL